jgi:O-antigen biosynthesis protein
VTLPTAAQPRVSIVVVAAKQPSRLVRCLTAVAREAPSGTPLETIVVLNAAEPTLRETLDREIVGARVVATEVSLGFAGGANLGARQARGEFLHLLHDDTEVCAGWLESLIDAMNNCPEAGAAGSLILNEDGTVQSAGAVLWRDGVTTPPWPESPPSPAFFGIDPFPVDYCASASLLIRREVWDVAGGLDEELYPAYYIDVDLALAVRSQGRSVVCAPQSRVLHERGGSSPIGFRQFVSERNRARIVVKWAEDLERQEPFEVGAEALEQAKRVTLQTAASLRPPPAAARPVAESPGSVPAQEERLLLERRALLRDISVKDAYIAELRAQNQAVLEDHARIAGTLDAIEAGGWWRLRGRLLPLLALAGRLRRLSRRGGTSRTE